MRLIFKSSLQTVNVAQRKILLEQKLRESGEEGRFYNFFFSDAYYK